ncbi:hypothetical protein OSB04_019541 [Centaurea solstitialis]|uniref:Integrase catalytic domain-containing protein n=1 Tax=Centaurea solstitialis TaxID=347529 RepID=A0AA38TA29_9ASTR|nr:hypothetical protein OSB04_019541 [Centaurea solstitialis]
MNKHGVIPTLRKQPITVVRQFRHVVGREKVVHRERATTPILGYPFDYQDNTPELRHQLPRRQVETGHEGSRKWRVRPSKSDLKRIFEQGEEPRRSKLIIISNNCPPLRKSEIEYYAMLVEVHHYIEQVVSYVSFDSIKIDRYKQDSRSSYNLDINSQQYRWTVTLQALIEDNNLKRSSHKTKSDPSFDKALQMLHVDLYRPIAKQSLNGKKYILVLVDEFSRYTWVEFVRKKSHVPMLLINLLKRL